MNRTQMRILAPGCAWAILIVLLSAVLLLAEGCMTSAISVTFTDSNAMVGFCRVEADALAPGFGAESGPRVVAKVARDQSANARFRGYATLSNTVEFAGIYSSTENKHLTAEVEMANAPTNRVDYETLE